MFLTERLSVIRSQAIERPNPVVYVYAVIHRAGYRCWVSSDPSLTRSICRSVSNDDARSSSVL